MSAKRIAAMVIGAGPGGYVAGIRLGQLGVDTVVVEKDSPGGVCLNWGCIPSKAIIHVAQQVEWLREHAADQGVLVDGFDIDGAALQKWKQRIVGKLTGGVAQLLKANGVPLISGSARFLGPHEVEIQTADGVERYAPDHVILATGCRTIEIPPFPFSDPRILSAREALELTEIPDRLVVIGGGVIGLELGSAYAQLGSDVTVVEALDTVLPGTDPDLLRPLNRALKRRGVTLHTSSKAEGYDEGEAGAMNVRITTPSGPETIAADKVLVAVGMRPDTSPLSLAFAGVQTDTRGFIPVDGECRTNVPHVFAIGDITGPPLLAHRSSKMGEIAAEVIAGHPASMDDVQVIPAAVYTDPEVATVGLSEAEALAAGYEVITGRFPLMANGRALTHGDANGLVKVVAEAGGGTLLGVGIVGPNASELIAECALAVEMAGTVEDLALVVHAHPTVAEAVMEAAKASRGEAIHAVN